MIVASPTEKSVRQKSLLDYLKLYRSEGLCFFAIPYGIKGDDRTKWDQWKYRKPTDTEIAAMFRDGRPYNIAMPAGPVSDNLTFVDLDNELVWHSYQEHYRKRTGKAITEATRVSHGKRGGVIWVKTETPVRSQRLPNDAGEIRNFGNYSVVPPSLHPSGVFYQVLNPGVPILRVPSLRDIFINVTAPEGKGPAPVIKGYIGEGSRDQTLTSLAGSMRRRGLPEAVIYVALRETNTRLCKPPLPDSAILKIAKSICRYDSPKREIPHGFRGGVPV